MFTAGATFAFIVGWALWGREASPKTPIFIEAETDNIAAYVNEEAIPKTLVDALADRQADTGQKVGDMDPLDVLITERLFAQEAKRLGLDQAPDYKADVKVFETQKLAASMANFLDKEHVTEDKLKALYDAQQALRRSGLEVRARQILVPDIETVKVVTDKLDDGEEFGALAFAYSIDRVSRDDGGDLGYIGRGMLDDNVTETIFTTDVGKRAEPLQSARGWHIIEVLDKRTPKDIPFETLKPKLKTILWSDVFLKKRDELKAKAKIEIVKAADNPEQSTDNETREE